MFSRRAFAGHWSPLQKPRSECRGCSPYNPRARARKSGFSETWKPRRPGSTKPHGALLGRPTRPKGPPSGPSGSPPPSRQRTYQQYTRTGAGPVEGGRLHPVQKYDLLNRGRIDRAEILQSTEQSCSVEINRANRLAAHSHQEIGFESLHRLIRGSDLYAGNVFGGQQVRGSRRGAATVLSRGNGRAGSDDENQRGETKRRGEVSSGHSSSLLLVSRTGCAAFTFSVLHDWTQVWPK